MKVLATLSFLVLTVTVQIHSQDSEKAFASEETDKEEKISIKNYKTRNDTENVPQPEPTNQQTLPTHPTLKPFFFNKPRSTSTSSTTSTPSSTASPPSSNDNLANPKSFSDDKTFDPPEEDVDQGYQNSTADNDSVTTEKPDKPGFLDPVYRLDMEKMMGRWFEAMRTVDGIDDQCVIHYFDRIVNNRSFTGLKIFMDDEIQKYGPQMTIYQYARNYRSQGMYDVTFSIAEPPIPFWIYKLGPIVNGLYQYLVVSNWLKFPVRVLTRNPDEFKEKYTQEVDQYLKENRFAVGLIYREDYSRCYYDPSEFQQLLFRSGMMQNRG